MKLIIAEKPTVARAIAGVIGGEQRGEGCIRCSGDTTVTWAFGHLLGLDSPENYFGGRIEISDLPVIPSEMTKIPRDGDAGKQLKTIVNLIRSAKSVVNGGDPDREGQLLIDEILEYAGYTGPVERIWLSSADPESVRNALAAIKPNSEYANLSRSAQCRSEADWLVGMNGSIALSRRIQREGGQGKFSIGRVQTPTLALIVDREHEMTGFTKRLHYIVSAIVMPGSVKAGWRMPVDLLSGDGLLLDKSVADATAARIKGKPAIVTAYDVKIGYATAPLPHSLSSLQKAASSKAGLSAKATLAAVQSLYEEGVLSYPRTDARYLPDEMHPSAARILQTLAGQRMAGASDADPRLKHAAFDTDKMKKEQMAHHAIAPTTVPIKDSASAHQKVVYDLVASAYIRLFHPPEKFESRSVVFDINSLTFTAKSRTTIEPGWTKLGAASDDEDDDTGREGGGTRLPDMTKGDRLTCDRAEIDARETKPPRPLNDGTLIGAMTSIHKLIDDPRLKARLKETSGLGTEATRAGIIETLIDRGYAVRKGKEIRATREGIDLIKVVRTVFPPAADPGVTAVWEDALAAVADGKLEPDKFIAAQHDAVRKMTAAIVSAQSIGSLAPKPTGQHCPDCKADLYAKKSKKGLDLLVCSGAACGAAFFKEKDGKPGQKLGTAREPDAAGPPCPSCDTPTGQFKTQAKGSIYYKCGAGHGVWWSDKSGGLGSKWEDKPKAGKKR